MSYAAVIVGCWSTSPSSVLAVSFPGTMTCVRMLVLGAGVMRVSAPGNPEPCLIPLPRASPSATASSPPAPAAPVPQPSASGAAPTTAAAAAASTRPGGGPAGHVRAQAGQAPSEQLPVVFAASSYSAADVAAGSPVPELATKDGASPAAAGGSAPHRSQPRGRAEGASAAGADSLANDDVSDAGSDAGSFTGSLVSNSGGPHLDFCSPGQPCSSGGCVDAVTPSSD